MEKTTARGGKSLPIPTARRKSHAPAAASGGKSSAPAAVVGGRSLFPATATRGKSQVPAAVAGGRSPFSEAVAGGRSPLSEAVARGKSQQKLLSQEERANFQQQLQGAEAQIKELQGRLKKIATTVISLHPPMAWEKEHVRATKRAKSRQG